MALNDAQAAVSEAVQEPSHIDSLFAAHCVTPLIQTMHALVQALKNNPDHDIEYVHKLRVTSRRIRTAFSIFYDCFTLYGGKAWEKQMKKVTKSLGQARDCDVQILFLEKLLGNLPQEAMRPGLEFLIHCQKKLRETLQPSVIQTLDELLNSQILEHILKTCEHITVGKEPSVQQYPLHTFCTAQDHIKLRFDEFLALEKYIEKPKAIYKHHQLRIAAKHLRYSLELFQPLYEHDQLKQFIEPVKHIQDVLGEVHDCDVWIEYIPVFLEEQKERLLSAGEALEKISEIERGLLLFLFYMRQRREQLYESFVTMWQHLHAQTWFEVFARFLKNKFILPKAYRVKCAVLADVHGNLHALTAVLADARQQQVSFFLNAGDLVGYGAFPDEVVRELSADTFFHVQGNYDQEVLRYKTASEVRSSTDLYDFSYQYTAQNLSKQSKKFLKKLPIQLFFILGDKKYLMVHGSPESSDEHITPDTSEERFQQLAHMADVDVIICGHAHTMFTKTSDRVLFINPGSVGRPGNHDPRASYMILESHPFSLQKRVLEYDVIAAADAMRTKGFPEPYAQMILQGVSLDTILDEQHQKTLKKTHSTLVNQLNFQMHTQKKMRLIKKIATSYDPDIHHALQVTKLSLRLFDLLKSIHRLQAEDRFLLESAALLHDIGWSLGGKSHHKSSLRLILNNQKLPFTNRERYLVSCIARYHRKKMPSYTDFPYADLTPEDKYRVNALGALLRVADGLDASHKKIITIRRITLNEKKVFVECSMDGIAELEIQTVDKKKDLFEKTFNRKLELVMQTT